MRRMRQLIGPATVGLAAWCAAGTVTVPADTAAVRLVVPAPVWVLIAATAIALAVAPWRRDPLRALPAILTTLPWWPVPLPAIALMWTGPLAWVPIGLAIAAAAFAPRSPRRSLSFAMTPSRQALAAGTASLALSALVAWAAAPQLPGGDEPHYLIITQSLLKDGDLRIENNHARRDYAEYFGGELRPDYLRRGKNGAIYSIHAPGLAAFVLPAFALAGYRGAQAMVMAAAAAAACLIWLAAWRATRRASAAWFAWAAVMLSTTALMQSVMIFPDGPGLLCVAAGVWLVVRLGEGEEDAERQAEDGLVTARAIVAVSALLAALPWLHTRFAILAGALGLIVVWRLTARARAAAPSASPAAWRQVLLFVALPAVSAIGWFAFFQVIYGTPNPSAPYGVQQDVSARFIPGAMLGLLVDQQYGVLAYAPVLAAAFAGVWGRGNGAARTARQLLAAAGVYAAAIGVYWMWWAGQPATPARFLTAALPLATVAIARTWVRADRIVRAFWLSGLAGTVGISAAVVAVDRARLAWNVRDACAAWLQWASPVVSLARGWPSFFWSLTPAVAMSETPFFVHAAVSVSALVVCIVAGVAVARRVGTPGGAAAAIGCSLAFGAMAFVEAGWIVNHVDGLDPIRSQIAVLHASQDRGARVIAAGAIGSATGRPVTLRPSRYRLPEFADIGAVFGPLPGGHYEIRGMSRRRVTGGALSVFAGGAREPWQRLSWPPLTEYAVGIDVPAAAGEVRLEPDAALQAAGLQLTLTTKAR